MLYAICCCINGTANGVWEEGGTRYAACIPPCRQLPTIYKSACLFESRTEKSVCAQIISELTARERMRHTAAGGYHSSPHYLFIPQIIHLPSH
jgi:hypothetical protein